MITTKKIIGIVALYAPKTEDIPRIEKYVDELDYCILMDDTGKDNSSLFAEFLGKHKVEYIWNHENIGLCASVNYGFKKACEYGADWILVMNPDGTFSNNAISIFRNYIENNNTDKVGIVCPQYNFDRHQRKAKAGVEEISYTDMAGSLYNASILKKMNYYDPNTYFYGLDTEYCLRVIRKKYKIVRCNEAVLNHHPAHTEEIKIGNKVIFRYGKDKPVRYYYQFRSGFYIHNKYHDLKQDLFMIYKFLKVVLLFDQKQEYLKCIRQAKDDAKMKYYGAYRNIKGE